jgi:ubiquitin-protein ligase E3 C
VRFADRVLILDHYLDKDHMDQGARRSHSGTVRIEVQRGTEYDDALEQMGALSGGEFKGRVQVEFINAQGLAEAGIDGGGLFKDFLLEVVKQAFDPRRGLWRATANGALYPNPSTTSALALRQYAFQGRVLGKAVYEGILVEVDLADFFLNLMLGNRNHLHDLQSLDAELYKNVVQLKSLLDPAALELTFSAAAGEARELVDLVPNGRNIAVTRDNVVHYIRRLASFRLNEEFHAQARAFFDGFSSLVPPKWIRMFKPRELQLIIGGSVDGYDVRDMRRYATYSGGYSAQQPYVEQFWEVVTELEPKHKALLLRFITSCSRPPLQGFIALHPPLCISQVRISHDAERLPTASTCVNNLKLPKYSSKEVLRDKLIYSITSASGFELS